MMYSTDDALSRGLRATARDRIWWSKLRTEFDWQRMLATHRGQLDLAFTFAFQCQFLREALEAREITERIKKNEVSRKNHI